MLNDIAHAEKHLRAMHRELKKLQRRQRNPPVHELHPPIQKGWKRHFVMTRAANDRPDATVLGEILAHLNTVHYFWRPDFRYTRRQGAKRGLVSIEQQLLAVDLHVFEREPEYSGWQKYFRPELVPREFVRTHYHLWRCGRWDRLRLNLRSGDYLWAYVFRFPALFELRVERHWLTHCTEIEPDVIERIAEIERWMEHRHGYQCFDHLKGRSQRSWHRPDERLKVRADQARCEMRAELGLLGAEAAEHIPSGNTVRGTRRVGCVQPLRRWWAAGRLTSFFAAVRLEILRSKTRRQRLRNLTGYRHFGQGPQALASCGEPFRVGPAGHFRANRMPRRQSADAVCQSEVQANGPGRLRPAFSAKNHRARVPRRPGNLSMTADPRGSEIGVTS